MRTSKCGELAEHMVGSEPALEMLARFIRMRVLWMKPQQSGQRPVHMHARMPVVAAVKDGMQRARRAQRVVAAEHLVKLVRILGSNVG